MAITPLMCWIKGRRGWLKEYQGRKYSVSCRQLGTPGTKEQSVLAANNWWLRRKDEIDGEHRANSTGSLVDALETTLGAKIPPDLLAQLLALRGGGMQDGVSVDAALVDWRNSLENSCRVGNLSAVRLKNYLNRVKVFRDFVGGDTLVSRVDGVKWEGFWSYLGRRKTEEGYSSETAAVVFRTAKHIITFCVAKKFMTYPANFQNKRLCIRVNRPLVRVFSLAEIRRLLMQDVAERTRLFVLLALNCGMYQQDISDLGESEVDWGKGWITRPRSKVPNGPVVRYMMWEDTLRLLTKYRAGVNVPNAKGDRRVLLSENNTPLVQKGFNVTGPGNYDCIHKGFLRAKQKCGFTLGFKHLRKTSYNLLLHSDDFNNSAEKFLAHSLKTVSGRYYQTSDNNQFFKALCWLCDQFFPA